MVPSDLDGGELRMPGAGVGAGVGLAVLSRDASLLDTIESVVTADHAIAICADASELAALIVSGRCGVALLDAGAIAGSLPQFAQQLREQFPDLVLVVAGRADDQSQLAKQIASGEIYRFLHKPVSAQRVRLFVEAAMRRHDEEHVGVAARMPTAIAPPPRRVATPKTPRWLLPAILGGIALVLGVWLLARPDAPSAPVDTPAAKAAAGTDPAVRELLARADAALKRGALLAPAGDNAAELYRRVLAADDANADARAGLDRVVNAVLTAAEKSILAGQLEAATRSVEAARTLQPDNVRIAFLSAQIARERERALLARARAAAASGDLGAALAALEGAPGGESADPSVAETRRALQREQLDDRIRTLLDNAAARLQRGALLEPAADNARFYIESARAVAPRDPRVSRLDAQLRARLLSQARQSAGGGDATATETWLRAAAESGAAAPEIAAIRTQLAAAQSAARAQEASRLASLVNQRIAQDRLLEPAGDSAGHWLAELQRLDASGDATASARQALGRALVGAGRAAIARRDAAGAQRLLGEAESLGAADLAPLVAELEALRVRQQAEASIVGAGSLRRTRYVEPDYPRAARDAGVEGWVDLEFTVRTDGSVDAISVTAAQPVGVFEDTAVAALARWRFAPVRRDGAPVEQRARLRMRFNIE
jgi:TonB family protein